MLSNTAFKDYRTAYLCKGACPESRYDSKTEQLDRVAKNMHSSRFQTFNYNDFTKTIDFKEHDDSTFSDNKIKNYTPHSLHLAQRPRRVPIYHKEAAVKRKAETSVGPVPVVKPSQRSQGQKHPHRSVGKRQNVRVLSARVGEQKPDSHLNDSVNSNRPSASAFDRRKQRNQNRSTEVKVKGNLSPVVICLKPPPRQSEPAKKHSSSKKYKIEIGSRGKCSSVQYNLFRGTVGFNVAQPKGKIVFDLPEQRIDRWEQDNPSFNEFQQIGSSSQMTDALQLREVKTSWSQRNYLQPKYV